MDLRPYQTEAVEAVWEYFRTHPKGHPLIVLPIGSGKSVVLAEIVRRACVDHPGTRILVLTHRAELALTDEQPAETQGETEDPWDDIDPNDTGWPTTYERGMAGRTE